MDITVEVHKWECDFDVPAVEFWKNLGDFIMGTPEEFRPLLRIELFLPYSEYSEGYLSLGYVRPETEEETAQREYKEQEQRLRYSAYKEHQERQILAALKAKYE